jgi:hypothetical protein
LRSNGRDERREHCNRCEQSLHRPFAQLLRLAPALALPGFAIITSVDLITASASSPRFSFSA